MQPAKLRLADGIGPVVPVAGESRRIEDLFVELNGQLWVGGVGYRVSDGVFKSLQGARAWVAVRPGSLHTSPLGLRLVLFELNGHIYYAGLQKAS